MAKKTRIFIDPSHSSWVLGGLAREIAYRKQELFEEPQEISNLRSKKFFQSLIVAVKTIFSKEPILFSSVTPLENYLKFVLINRNYKALIFTHQDGSFSSKHLKIFKKVNLFFVFSEIDKLKLIECGVVVPIVKFIGGINTELFHEQVLDGDKIVFIGTPVERKNPGLFLEFVSANPNLKFKILGRGWANSQYWNKLESLGNLEYQEVSGPVSSFDLMGCSHYLMLSRIEGGPMTLIEAVAAGLVPICAKTGIVEDFLGATGYQAQILSSPINFEEIIDLIHKDYSKEYIEASSKRAKYYSIERLAGIFENGIKSHFYLDLEDK